MMTRRTMLQGIAVATLPWRRPVLGTRVVMTEAGHWIYYLGDHHAATWTGSAWTATLDWSRYGVDVAAITTT